MKGPLGLLPPGALTLLKEVGRHLLRRPVVGIVLVARRADGAIALIRRGDTGTWALPGGTLEWNETLALAAERELHEECGAELLSLGPVAGVYSRPDRDPRFHAVTIVAHAKIGDELRGPVNPLEIREARFFREGDVPKDMAMSTGEMLRAAIAGDVVLE